LVWEQIKIHTKGIAQVESMVKELRKQVAEDERAIDDAQRLLIECDQEVDNIQVTRNFFNFSASNSFI
jgi:hypothetical protein